MDEKENILSQLNQIEDSENTTAVNIEKTENAEVVDNVNSEIKSEEPLKKKKEPPKKIEVIEGNGDLTISPVREHLEVEKPKPKENRKIFIPEVKKKKP